MKDLIKLNKKVCGSCKYRMRFGSAPGGQNTFYNHCCNYLEIMGHSRIFENGKQAYDPKYCDKFEKGKAEQTKINWNQQTSRRVEEGETDDFSEI